ncbi:hypothetical protein D9M71_415390 [compost metagenome]
MCGSSNTVTLRRLSSPTASAAMRALACSKRSASRLPASPVLASPAKSPKRVSSALRSAALLVCGSTTALTTPVQRMPRLISSTRHSACMKAPSGCSVAGMPIITAV